MSKAKELLVKYLIQSETGDGIEEIKEAVYEENELYQESWINAALGAINEALGGDEVVCGYCTEKKDDIVNICNDCLKENYVE